MAIKDKVAVETKPYILFLNQIKVVQEHSDTPLKNLKQATAFLQTLGVNTVLPMVCLTDQEDQYQLLTGLPIYAAAKSAGLEKIWAFVIAAQPHAANQALEQWLFLSKLNNTVIEPQDIDKFLTFINSKKSVLTEIAGIGDKMADKIIAGRPYESLAAAQQQLGDKRIINWIRAFKRK
jgi:DNA uptake protein ComE-like DNA-binding protein